jgi:hypothetical protein
MNRGHISFLLPGKLEHRQMTNSVLVLRETPSIKGPFLDDTLMDANPMVSFDRILTALIDGIDCSSKD